MRSPIQKHDARDDCDGIRKANGSCRCEGRLSSRRWYARPENARKIRNNYLSSRYGITLAEYEEMERQQDGKCQICGKRPPRLAVDHSHETKSVRALLCTNCNTAVGMLDDDPALAEAVAAYLRVYG
jgi:hypothetical protein